MSQKKKKWKFKLQICRKDERMRENENQANQQFIFYKRFQSVSINE